ncbi:MBL fold metallo-hydrolase [Paraglaciecola arctica]|uniref:Beta-lactamase-like protein n=1 Tax=Paraglaciecola arctica BSs20135 TaxID=493475 RepID=K6ZFH7_9ALTE|nr:MBL fold metallo-hydrolase [Paraglaciecola arctica]GAC22165.1 beta-lactamase-like protein [Paraglaciecola arctica BSs20135]
MFKQVSILTVLLLLMTFSSSSFANQCKTDQIKLQVLGSGGPELDDGRNSSGYLIWYQNKARVLIDAGAGSSVEYGRSGAKFEDLQGILLTHLHVDHSADLAAFIKGSYFTSRSTNLLLYGPAANDLMPSTSDYLQRLMGDKGAFAYLKDYVNKRHDSDYKVVATDVPLVIGQTFDYSLGNNIKAKATFVHHGPVAAVAWRVELAGCSIVFSGDMNNQFDVLSAFANGADILVANNAVPDNASGAAINLHMTPSTIAKIAKKAQIKQLVLSHFMKRTLAVQKETKSIISQKYPGPIYLATDGMVVSL